MILKNNTVNVGVYGHNSTIENETVVYIHHLKNCKNPCKMTDVIIDYLELESQRQLMC